MVATLTFHPLGDADGTLIDLADGRKILIDFGDECTLAKDERRIDLAANLWGDLVRSGRPGYDAVLFTHLDRDHCYGAEDFFWFDHSPRLQGPRRARIGDLWVPAAAILEPKLPAFAQVIQNEARYRLLRGYGVKVFSRPEALAGFLAMHGRTLADVAGLVVNAGGTVPGYELHGP
jgi:glyoxylase-like metal-dependent hydrolase (beta-lactamase superfamily II)